MKFLFHPGRKWVFVSLGVLILLLAACSWQAFSKPAYSGHSLEYWLVRLEPHDDSSGGDSMKAREALKSAGATIVPELRAMLQAEDRGFTCWDEVKPMIPKYTFGLLRFPESLTTYNQYSRPAGALGLIDPEGVACLAALTQSPRDLDRQWGQYGLRIWPEIWRRPWVQELFNEAASDDPSSLLRGYALHTLAIKENGIPKTDLMQRGLEGLRRPDADWHEQDSAAILLISLLIPSEKERTAMKNALNPRTPQASFDWQNRVKNPARAACIDKLIQLAEETLEQARPENALISHWQEPASAVILPA